jgi:hypothetical protein
VSTTPLSWGAAASWLVSCLKNGLHSVDCAWTKSGLVGSTGVFGGNFRFRFRFAISQPRDRNGAKRQPCDQK